MHSALLIVQKPQDADSDLPRHRPAAHLWSDYLNSQLAAVNRASGAIKVLGEGCVEITMDSGADALAEVMHAASASGLEYRVLFFKKQPQWITKVHARPPQ